MEGAIELATTIYDILTLSRFRMRISNMGFGLFGLATNTYETIVYGYQNFVKLWTKEVHQNCRIEYVIDLP